MNTKHNNQIGAMDIVRPRRDVKEHELLGNFGNFTPILTNMFGYV